MVKHSKKEAFIDKGNSRDQRKGELTLKDEAAPWSPHMILVGCNGNSLVYGLIPEISYVPQSTDMNVLKVTFNSERIIELPRKRGSGNAFDLFRQTRCDLVAPLPFFLRGSDRRDAVQPERNKPTSGPKSRWRARACWKNHHQGPSLESPSFPALSRHI